MDQAFVHDPSVATLAAGDFSAWLRDMRAALAGYSGTEVPCGDCVGCCVSSYFIHVRPHESAALARIPEEVRVRAPHLARGHVMMGYDPHGRCPMLVEHQCSIYENRPQTCRDYDCRIFAATGLAAGDASKATINARVAAWRFSYPTDADRREHAAVLATATFISANGASFPGGRTPSHPSQIAVMAVKAYEVFLRAPADTCAETAVAVLAACRAFDAQVNVKPTLS